ncbi:MAG TPA: tetratricopeptide repeat protein, partial [Elusimicrobiota bacterium]|nr:tetratricopeptide repeat protein [Elusimicrobiota bacterium]
SRDKVAALEAYERFLHRFPDSPRAADAQFMAGEAYLDQAVKILKAESASKRAPAPRPPAPKTQQQYSGFSTAALRNPQAISAIQDARSAYQAVLERYHKEKTGLRASAQYRLGETAYDAGDWTTAIEEWKRVERDFPKSYIMPEAWMGIVFANLALEQFGDAESNLFLLGETYPNYLKVPEVLYAQGIINLHKGDYPNAEKALKQVNSAEAAFYLGKTYLLSKRPYLAAAAFERLSREYPAHPLVEETEFFIGDSFFLAKDFDGAITKYQRFLSKYPESPLRVSALFRIGSAHFQKQNFVEARAHFQSVIDRYPKDFFAPLSQYFIAESYLVENQFREALFAYTKVITQFPETVVVSPLAHYKLAWAQYQVGDYAQSAQTSRNFLSLYPTHTLAKNVYLILGNALLGQKRHTEAVTAFQRIIDVAPTSDVAEQALFSILQTQYNLKSYNSILTSYQFIFRHLPPSQSRWRPLSYLYAAEAYLQMNRVDEAKAIYEMVLKVYPNDQAAFYAQDGLAWSYSMLGDDEGALAERKKLKDMLSVLSSSFTFSGDNELGIADSMYNRKEYEDAYQLYDKFAKENTASKLAPEALYRAGMSLYHLRYYTQAIETWQRLQANYPNAPETPKAEYQVADTLFRAQKYKESAAAYRAIMAKFPKSDQLPLAYLRLAMSAFNLKDDAGALNGALTLISKFPDAPEATDGLDLMEAVFDRSKSADFAKSLGAVIAAVPGTPIAGDAQFRIGRRYFEAKAYAEASAAFQKFSVDYTGNAKLKKAQFLLGEAYFNAGRNSDSVFAFTRFLENFPKSEDTPLALFHLASAHYSAKEYEPASEHYQRLIDDYPSSEYVKAAQFNLALSYKALGKLDRAQEAYSRYANTVGEKDETGKAALWEIFAIQKDQKDFVGAMGTLSRILDNSPDAATAAEAGYRKGEVSQLMGEPDEARRAWEAMIGKAPKKNSFRLQALIKLGETYEKAEENARAAATYEDLAANASGQVAAAARQRAVALRKAGPGKARKTAKAGDTAVGDGADSRSAVNDVPDDNHTMVMPDETKPAAASKKTTKKSAKKPAKKTATAPAAAAQ